MKADPSLLAKALEVVRWVDRSGGSPKELLMVDLEPPGWWKVRYACDLLRLPRSSLERLSQDGILATLRTINWTRLWAVAVDSRTLFKAVENERRRLSQKAEDARIRAYGETLRIFISESNR